MRVIVVGHSTPAAPTWQPSHFAPCTAEQLLGCEDRFKHEVYLLPPAVLLGIITAHEWTLPEVMWTASIWRAFDHKQPQHVCFCSQPLSFLSRIYWDGFRLCREQRSDSSTSFRCTLHAIRSNVTAARCSAQASGGPRCCLILSTRMLYALHVRASLHSVTQSLAEWLCFAACCWQLTWYRRARLCAMCKRG